MNILESFRISLDALIANKMRSILTMLGVIIGVMAVILLISLGQGVKSDVTRQISELGSNLLFVFPGRLEPGSQHSAFSNKLVPDDVKLLKRGTLFIKEAVGSIETTAVTKFRNRTRRTNLLGTNASYSIVLDRPTAQGRFFTESQEQAGRRVCVIGKTVADDLFDDMDPIGKRITLNGQKYLVLGVLEEKGRFMGMDFDDSAYIPLSTAATMMGSDKLSNIMVKAEDSSRIKDAQREIKRALGKKYTSDDYTVFTQGETLSMMENVLRIMTLMLVGIASISLLVGGIGIMNIMLVSVTERTREIGIRKAVGARTYDIMIQFIIEAVLLSLFGGAIGILLGIGGAQIANNWLPAEITVWSILLSFGFAATVGIFSGVYPAYKASRLDPIEALRYE
jgi:putative ABC transport system permease protein